MTSCITQATEYHSIFPVNLPNLVIEVESLLRQISSLDLKSYYNKVTTGRLFLYKHLVSVLILTSLILNNLVVKNI